MKTISGRVVSTAPTSLSGAAKVISKFACFENGASNAVSVYLRRTSEAFDALVRFHKDLKAPHSPARKQKPHRGDKYESKSQFEEDNISKILLVGEGNDVGDVLTERSEKKMHRKEKSVGEHVKIERDGGNVDALSKIKAEKELQTENGGNDVGDVLTERSDKKKHRKEKSVGEDVKIERDGGSVDVLSKIKDEKELQPEDGDRKRDKKKRKKREEEEGEGVEAEDKEKKRKSGEQVVDLTEKSRKKSKKRKM